MSRVAAACCRHRFAWLGLAAVLALTAGCQSEKIAPTAPANRHEAKTAAPGARVGMVDFAVLRSALAILRQRAVERPASDALLNAAWDGLLGQARNERIQTAGAARPVLSGDPTADFASFVAAFGKLTIEPGHLADDTKLNYAAVDRMAQSLDDSHTTFLPPDALQRQNKREAGNLGTTTGLRLERVADRPPVVLEVAPGSAAALAGVHAGDAVLALNGRKIQTYTPREAGRSLDGPDGSKLVLDLRRPGGGDRRITVVRQTVALDLVRSRILPGNVGYIRIREFPGQVPIQRQVAQALGDFQDAATGGVIVDLRGNPGGALGILQFVLSQFVSQSPLSFLVTPDGRSQPIARSGSFDFHQRLVVLVDDGSASSAELFASAVQEYHDGLIVGATTCGCLMAAQFFTLADDKAGLEIALEGVLSPVARQKVEKAGIVPDTAVSADPAALAEGRDPQLEAALQALGVDSGVARGANQVLLKEGP